MPLSIPNTTTTNDFADARFAGHDVFAQGFFIVANATVECQMLHGIYGQADEGPSLFLPPGTYPITAVPKDPIAGIQFRSAVPGTPAQVFGVLFYPNEAIVQAGSSFDASISPGGGFTPPAGSGIVELGFAQQVADVASAASTEGTAVLLVQVAVTIPSPPGNIDIEAELPAYNNGNNLSETVTWILRDETNGVVIGRIQRDTNNAQSADIRGFFRSKRYTPPAPGPVTYSLRAYGSAGSTITHRAGAGGSQTYTEISLRVTTAP